MNTEMMQAFELFLDRAKDNIQEYNYDRAKCYLELAVGLIEETEEEE